MSTNTTNAPAPQDPREGRHAAANGYGYDPRHGVSREDGHRYGTDTQGYNRGYENGAFNPSYDNRTYDGRYGTDADLGTYRDRTPQDRTDQNGGRTPKRTGRTIAITAAALLAAGGIAAGLIVGFSGGSTPAPAAAPVAAATASGTGSDAGQHVTPSGGGSSTGGNGGGGHVNPPNPPAPPSAAIETLQKELGQLNYYEGPVTGVMNTQTTQAITYLQRDAGLPQTGTMNSATQAALAKMLKTGNNQMGGNS